VSNDLRRMEKNSILAYFELMFRDSTSEEIFRALRAPGMDRRTVSIDIYVSCINKEKVPTLRFEY
jgi:hypothetical protein